MAKAAAKSKAKSAGKAGKGAAAKKPAVKQVKAAAKVVKKATAPAKAPAKTKQIKKPAPAKKPAVVKKAVVKKAASAPKASIPKKVPAPKATKAVTKAVSKPSGPLGYTPDQYEKYKAEVAKLKDRGNNELKEMLKKNMQSMSGTKDELVAKVADGIVLGRIPRCPNCFGGRPKFDSKTGTYNCPGYRDDVDFKNCHKTFTLAEITRDPWE